METQPCDDCASIMVRGICPTCRPELYHIQFECSDMNTLSDEFIGNANWQQKQVWREQKERSEYRRLKEKYAKLD